MSLRGGVLANEAICIFMEKHYYVYIATNKGRTVLYTGVTNSLLKRMGQHKERAVVGSFTDRYNINILVYYEIYGNISQALFREKQIKAGSRKKKIDLIIGINPGWSDLLKKI
jgi:putative endonuclease